MAHQYLRNFYSKISLILIGSGFITSCSVVSESAEEGKKLRPILTTAGVVHVCPENKIVLIERGKAPKGLAMFGGHVEYESPRQAFVREAQEELSITDIQHLQLIGVHGNPGRDPRQHSVEVTFSCLTHQKPKAASDAKNVILYNPQDLRKQLDDLNFAFDHKEIIKKYLQSLKSCNPCKKACYVGLAQDSIIN